MCGGGPGVLGELAARGQVGALFLEQDRSLWSLLPPLPGGVQTGEREPREATPCPLPPVLCALLKKTGNAVTAGGGAVWEGESGPVQPPVEAGTEPRIHNPRRSKESIHVAVFTESKAPAVKVAEISSPLQSLATRTPGGPARTR